MRCLLIFSRLSLAVSWVCFLSSCASVSVKEATCLDPNPPSRRPDKVLVAPFTFSSQEIRVDRAGADLEDFKFNLCEHMTRNLVRRLPKSVAPAEAVAANAALPQGNFWLVRGNFDRIYQGSRFLRAVVGLGAGATLMDTTTVVYDLSGPYPRPFLRIVTTGGSNISPGIGGVATIFVSGPMALTNLFNVVDGARSGVTFDTVRTTREVNAVLSEFLYQRGAIPRRMVAGPKRLGKLPDWFGQPNREKKTKGSLTVEPAQQ